jgi:hypothetical protein
VCFLKLDFTVSVLSSIVTSNSALNTHIKLLFACLMIRQQHILILKIPDF